MHYGGKPFQGVLACAGLRPTRTARFNYAWCISPATFHLTQLWEEHLGISRWKQFMFVCGSLACHIPDEDDWSDGCT